MNCIIVDERKSRKLLEEIVSGNSSLNLTGSFNDSISAITHLSKRDNTDLAFVDIKLAGRDFFDRIRNLGNPPNIVVLASTVQEAREALDYDVIDFLIKPVNYSRFTMAVKRAISVKIQNASINSDERDLFIKEDSSLVKMKMKDIIYAEALEDNTALVTNEKKYKVHYTLEWIENQLPSDIIIRVHKSYIVNKRVITSISKSSLELITGSIRRDLPIDRSFSPHLMNTMNIMAGE